MGYKRVKNSQKKIFEGRTARIFLKRFIPLYPLDYQLVTHQIQLTKYRRSLLDYAKPLHKLVTY